MDSLPVAVAADTETRRPASSNVDGMAEQMSYTNEQLLEAADILDAAHDVLLENGWTRGLGMLRGGGDCIETAVNKACEIHHEGRIVLNTPALFAANKLWLSLLLRDRGLDFPWNDAKDRTEDEVFERLRTVAKELREEASS